MRGGTELRTHGNRQVDVQLLEPQSRAEMALHGAGADPGAEVQYVVRMVFHSHAEALLAVDVLLGIRGHQQFLAEGVADAHAQQGGDAFIVRSAQLGPRGLYTCAPIHNSSVSFACTPTSAVRHCCCRSSRPSARSR